MDSHSELKTYFILGMQNAKWMFMGMEKDIEA